jgi:4a-hydroxytetrahydrobiopterin dehydratase
VAFWYYESMRKLSSDEINTALKGVEGWQIKQGKLHKQFIFDDFTAAFAFMTDLAAVAERLNHHPDWSNSYNRVTISLNTHDIGGLSKKDFDFAEAADRATK